MNQTYYVSARNILDFLKSRRKLIISSGFIGLIISGIYVLIVPARYEAKSIIGSAYVYNLNSGEVRVLKNVPELIKIVELRLSNDKTHNNDCKAEESRKDISLSPSKFSSNSIAVKVSKPTLNQAIECGKVVVDSVIAAQENIFVYMTRRGLKQSEQLEFQIKLVNKALSAKDVSTSDIIAGNSVILELDNNRADITKKTLLEFSFEPPKLINQISVSRVPSYFRIASILIAGFLTGLFISCLLFFKPFIPDVFRKDKNSY